MFHKETKIARKIDVPYRDFRITEAVYDKSYIDFQEIQNKVMSEYYCNNEYKIYFGEMHGHTNLSDGDCDIDFYFDVARNKSKLDFCAISDHDHGGVGKKVLYGGKWDITKDAVKRHNEEGKFVTLLGYEKDAYPWYNNLNIYYDNDSAAMINAESYGEISKLELSSLLLRKDLITIPHTTSFINSGCDFTTIPLNMMSPLIEIYSRWGCSEYFGNENPVRIETAGGFWQDALEKGAIMGCVAGSDDHHGLPGAMGYEIDHPNLLYPYPGITAVLAKKLTRKSIFDALVNRRCYAVMGKGVYIDFSISGNPMGSVLSSLEERDIYFNVESEEELVKVTLIKNSKEYIVFHTAKLKRKESGLYAMSEIIIDRKKEKETDYYYIRVEMKNKRFAWTSPIWVKS